MIYAVNFTAHAGDFLRQMFIDILNNTHRDTWVMARFGIYSSSGERLAEVVPVRVLEPLDQMLVSDMYVTLTEDGVYYAVIVFDHDIFVAQAPNGTSVTMPWAGDGLPDSFVAEGVSGAVPLSVYGCVAASHYLCATFQYYQGDDYSPLAVDYFYNGLLLAQGPNGTNSKGTWQSVLYSVGYLTTYVRTARFGITYVVGWTDILLTRPGNASYIYTSGNNGATLDDVGISFVSNDDYGAQITFTYNATSGTYVDSTDPELGPQLLVNFTIAPVNRSLGLPQCSYLYLPQDVVPASALTNSAVCPPGNQPVRWGDADRQDFFYTEEGFYPTQYTNIVLTPFSTGPSYSNVTQLSITLGQNANVFAHMRAALYFGKALDLLAESEGLVIDNLQDVTLYFTLNQTVMLYPAQQYYIAMWSDVSLFVAAGWDYSGLCYTGVTYGYDLQPWPERIGSQMADYYRCHSLPVAALGCALPTGPPYLPPIDPDCPPVNTSQHAYEAEGEEEDDNISAGTLFVSLVVCAILSALITLLLVWLVINGRCNGLKRVVKGSQRGDTSGSATVSVTDSHYAVM